MSLGVFISATTQSHRIVPPDAQQNMGTGTAGQKGRIMRKNIRVRRGIRRLYRRLWKWKWPRPLMVRHWPQTKMKIGAHTYFLGIWDNLADRQMYITGAARSIASVSRLTALVAGKNSLIYDIGANVGSFTLPLAACAGHGSKIIAFEPIPKLADRLRENLQINNLLNDVIVEVVALGSKTEEAALHLSETNLGASSLHPISSERSINISIKPLSQFLHDTDSNFQIFVIKIDVEGFEDEVLIPFLSTIPQDRLPDAIMMEVNHRKRWRMDLFEFLQERGYKPFFVGEEDNALFLMLT